MAWIIVRSRSTSCKTFGIIEASDDVLEDGIVDLELGREIVRRFDAVSLLLKIKQTRVVTLVGFAKELVQPAISVFAIQQRLQSPIHFNAAVLADAQKHDPVDRALDGEVKIALRQLWISQCQIPRQIGAPFLDLAQECIIDFRSFAFRLVDSANLSNDPFRIASRAKIFAMSSHRDFKIKLAGDESWRADYPRAKARVRAGHLVT